MPVSGSPKLIAAVHVLHRLPIPRHPPRALSSLTVIPKARVVTRDRGSSQELQPQIRRSARSEDLMWLSLDSSGSRHRLVYQHTSLFSFQRRMLRRAPRLSPRPPPGTSSLGRAPADGPDDDSLRTILETCGRFQKPEMELTGIEPVTLGLQSRCSPS